MKNCVFVLYNKLSQRYGDVFCYPTEAFAVNALCKGLDSSKLEEHELCLIGKIDISSGMLETFPPVRVPLKIESTTPVSEAE